MCCGDSPVVRHGRLIGIQAEFTPQVAEMASLLLNLPIPVFVNEGDNQSRITTRRIPVPGNFGQGREAAEILEKQARCLPPKITGRDAFILYDTYGFPWELTQEIAAEQGITVDVAEL